MDKDISVFVALGGRSRRNEAVGLAMDGAMHELDDGGPEDEIRRTLDVGVRDEYARDIAFREEGVLIADQTAAVDPDAVAARFERHGLPHPPGVVADLEIMQQHVVGLHRKGIAVVGGQLPAIDDLAGIVVPDQPHVVGIFPAPDHDDLVLVNVERHFLAVSAGHDPHRAPLRRFRRQGVEARLDGPEIPAAVAIDGINRLCRGPKAPAEQNHQYRRTQHGAVRALRPS